MACSQWQLFECFDMAGDAGGDEAGWEQSGRHSSSRSGRGRGRGSGPSQPSDSAAPAWGQPNTSQPSTAPQVQAVAVVLLHTDVWLLLTACCQPHSSGTGCGCVVHDSAV